MNLNPPWSAVHVFSHNVANFLFRWSQLLGGGLPTTMITLDCNSFLLGHQSKKAIFKEIIPNFCYFSLEYTKDRPSIFPKILSKAPAWADGLGFSESQAGPCTSLLGIGWLSSLYRSDSSFLHVYPHQVVPVCGKAACYCVPENFRPTRTLK